ncbi:MAG: Flp pilus assembly complex ATPase component TadA [Candidatus Moranbacteria bacterium]|nr:Flp pilus assembly complex ATPase component TadA [Candidatus Moranbacteria bacterium]
MRISNEQLQAFIQDVGIVGRQDLEATLKIAQKSGRNLGDILLEQKMIEETELQKLYAHILGIPFVDLQKQAISPLVLQLVPEPIARKYNVVAFEKDGSQLKIAMINPDDLQTIDFVKKKTGLRVVPCLTTKESMKELLRQYTQSLKSEFGDIITKEAEDVEEGEGNELEKIAQDLPIVRIVDTLIKHAIIQSASDIHIEPGTKDVHVRYRIDGILHDAMTLPKQVLSGLVARIKVLSNLKLDEHRLPQDGRFKIENEEHKISFRVSILPIFDGEKIVMRLLDESSKGLTLEKMGLHDEALETIHRQIKKPNGMILVTGPTGSGKTTTLYTIVDILNTQEVNISTVEDPVEYRMERINQTQVNSKIGMTFAAGLRSLLRQDPDIIMVGEIRDGETLEIAIHAAMTGHLVLSTLHTNSAAGAVPRMLDMGAEAFLVASTTNIIVAQRLIRKLCGDCAEEYTLEQKEIQTLGKDVDMETILSYLKTKKYVKENQQWKDIVFHRPKGCKQCNNEGYKGRNGIYEVLEIDEDIEKMIVQSASTETIERKAKEKGMATMVEDGFYKAIQGITSIEEVLRVTKE